jgi:hypothetical protein
MQSTLTAKPSDDPHDVIDDVVVVAPDAIRVAPSDVAPAEDELSALLHQAARHRTETPARTAPDFAVGPTVPPVDTTFRSAAVNDVPVSGKRGSMLRRTMRAFTALLLALCIGVAAFAWRSSGIAAKQMIAQWTPQFILTWLPPDNLEPAAQPAAPAVVQADAADATPPQPAPPVQASAETTAPAAAQLQSMAHDLASLGQQVEQLKASIEQLKAGQSQTPREAARTSELSRTSEPNRVSEPNLRPKLSALAPRPPIARVRKPTPPLPLPQTAIAPALPPATASYPAAAPYYPPRSAEPPPQATEQLTDPELAAVPRPPMPLR